MPDEILNAEEAAQLLGVSEYTMGKWRREGAGPKWFRISDGPKSEVRYRRAAIYQWIEAREAAQEEGKR
jgi:predicted DNA-binding transcriptional regulator AlpA